MTNSSKMLRGILLSTAIFGAVSFAQAGPGPHYWKTLHNEAEFQTVKSGEHLVYVCKECNTVSELPVSSSAQAMELTKEGATITCPSCKKVSKAVRKQSRNDPSSSTEITYVNDKGEECGFIAKVPNEK